jgi:hypothetical protein
MANLDEAEAIERCRSGDREASIIAMTEPGGRL